MEVWRYLSRLSVGVQCREHADILMTRHMMSTSGWWLRGGVRGEVIEKVQKGKADLTDMSMLGSWRVLIGEWLILE